ncbi:hypothetical protein [Neptuniibacter sp.]|uniref:hypothetical protein n=1 Tax=Neptuniibacter sp. TaxID=1962643 RepID=UPI002637C968|nr:hypothetical protein [Neptuniibacter sp.]MCP4595731.1 hypothetical protein [Neptuniibacter sp.]
MFKVTDFSGLPVTKDLRFPLPVEEYKKNPSPEGGDISVMVLTNEDDTEVLGTIQHWKDMPTGIVCGQELFETLSSHKNIPNGANA